MEKRAEALGPTGERVRLQLRKLRQERGLTLRELADTLHQLGRPIVLSSLSKIEKGQRRVDADDLVALALALRVSPNQILLPDDLTHGEEVHLTQTHSLSLVDARSWVSSDRTLPANDKDLDQVAEVLDLANALRTQIAAFHSHLRLPHLGFSRTVPYQDLYLETRLQDADSTLLSLRSLTVNGSHTVVLGDPGAGKSVLLAKIAHDLAVDPAPDHKAQVPLLLPLREWAIPIGRGEGGLVEYLKSTCMNPYNIKPPPDAIEYLLRNARAVVLLDGLDELTEIELRRKFVALVDVFTTQYPRVPVVVSARKTGYSDAPLDSTRFTTRYITELTTEQVEEYVRNWFKMSEALSPAEQARLAESLLRESQEFSDLRTNPLTLGLLCAVHARENFLTHNRAHVYERCASMLFNSWDRQRGIASSQQFAGSLRAAVQRLAWLLLTASPATTALPRRRIILTFSDYLVSKGFDEDEAETVAEQFLEYCTGRSWILTEAGSTSTEPLYAFTHRTFLEYFTAHHLVRTARTAGELWETLEARVMSGEWNTIAQIAAQLYDQNVEDGINELISHVLSAKPPDKKSRAATNDFLAEAAHSNLLSHRVHREVKARISSREM